MSNDAYSLMAAVLARGKARQASSSEPQTYEMFDMSLYAPSKFFSTRLAPPPRFPAELDPFEKTRFGVQLPPSTSDEHAEHKPVLQTIYRDGIYTRVKNGIGEFYTRTSTHEIAGLESGKQLSSFRLALPKIPSIILSEMLAFYRKVMEQHDGAEAYSSIFFDLETRQYSLYVPPQRVSQAYLTYSNEDMLNSNPPNRYIEVASCHSHNNMNAFFSSTDDNDEQSEKLYIVLGKINSSQGPMALARAAVKGKNYIHVDINDIFEDVVDIRTFVPVRISSSTISSHMSKIMCNSNFKFASRHKTLSAPLPFLPSPKHKRLLSSRDAISEPHFHPLGEVNDLREVFKAAIQDFNRRNLSGMESSLTEQKKEQIDWVLALLSDLSIVLMPEAVDQAASVHSNIFYTEDEFSGEFIDEDPTDDRTED